MTTIQGDFTNAEAAERAKSALQQAGIAGNRIRTWNILGDSGAGQESGSAVTTGAVLGGVLGGGAGLVAGAGIGAVVDGGYENTPHLSAPSGVCVVVDIEGDEQNVKEVLLSSGAANVHIGPVAR